MSSRFTDAATATFTGGASVSTWTLTPFTILIGMLRPAHSHGGLAEAWPRGAPPSPPCTRLRAFPSLSATFVPAPDLFTLPAVRAHIACLNSLLRPEALLAPTLKIY